MAEAVDAIIADLSVRYQQYVDGFDKATAAHDRFTKSVPKVGVMTGISAGDAQQYADRHTKASNDIASAEEAATVKITRTRKARADSATAADKAETASAKVAAKTKADVGISEAERELAAKTRMANIEAGLAEQAARRTSRSGPLRGTGLNDGPQTPLKSNAAAFINGGAATEEVAAEKEINHLLADQAVLQANLTAAKGADKAAIREQIAEIRLENQLRRAGLDDEAILLRIEERRAFVAAEAAAAQKKQTLNSATKFAEGAGIGRGGGSIATVGGIVAGAAVAGIAAAAKEGLDYAADLSNVSKQLGLTTRDLQVYQTGAERVGVTNEQLRTSFGQLASNIGKAQEGAKEQGKIFGKDGLAIDLGNARDGYKSLGDLLPSIVDRFSQIKDPARRAALETALFGESGRKLDSLLSGGTDAISKLGDELERTGGILSGEDIARSAKVAADLKLVGDQLERELASTVSQNAAAIESLAKSLLNAASSMLQFISAFQRLQAQRLITSGEPGVAAAGRATLNQSPEGRATLRRANDAQLRALRDGAKSDASLLNVGGDVGDTDIFGAYSGLVKNTPEGRAAARRQLLAQRRTIVQSESDAKAANAGADATPQDGKPGNLNVFAPDPKKAPKGKSAEAIEAERLERDKRFTAAEAQEQLARLGFLTDLTSDTRQQDQYARERITIESAAKDKELRDQAEATINRQKLKGVAAALERTRAEQLARENDANTELAIQVINRREQSRLLDEQLAHLQTAAGILSDDLNAQLSFATTAKDRAAIEKRLLALSIESERAALQKQIDDKATTPEARADAQARIDALPSKQRAQQAVLDRQNENPIQRYRRGLDDPQTAIQQAVADKLKSVDDAITDEAAKVLGVKDPFLKSLLQIFLQQNVLKPLYDAVQSASKGGGGGIGSIFGNILNAFGGGGGSASVGGVGIESSGFDLSSIAGSVPGFASGGGGTIGGNPGIDRNLLSINGRPVAKVGAGELLSISPNVAASNRAVQSPQPNVTVLQPIHADFTGARTDEQTMRQFQAYADARSKQAYDAAVAASASQAPGILARREALGN